MAMIGIIADDLTGAMTAGSLLSKAGVDTTVLLKTDYLRKGEPVCERQAVILNLNSRSAPREIAYRRVHDAVLRLRETGIRQFSKRIDTTLRGDIGTEIDAMLDALGEDYIAVMVPAMPQSNRILIGGYSIIDGVPLSKTSVAHDVKTPVRESFVPRLLASQTRRNIGYVELDELLKGEDSLRKSLQKKREDGVEILLVDATSIEDVAMIADTIVDLGWKTVSVDPGPFTEKMVLSRGWAAQRPMKLRRIRNKPEADDEGTVVVVAGSATPVTTMQINALRRVPGTHTVPVRVPLILSDEEACRREIAGAVNQTVKLLKSSPVPRVIILAFETTLTGELIDLSRDRHRGFAEGDAADHMATCLGRIVRETMNKAFGGVTGMYLTGGDIMASTCRMLDAKGIELIDYVIPQADQGRLVGGPFAGLSLIGKGGLTGERNTAIQCVNRLFDERKYNHAISKS